MDGLTQALCLFCIVTSGPPQPQLPQIEGDIWFTQRTLGSGAHLLRLSTTDLIVDSNSARGKRLYAFAYRFAWQSCHGRFNLAVAERAFWPEARPLYTKQYVFRCQVNNQPSSNRYFTTGEF